jgi:glycosyltransferase involved in cell wall biosynthesis
MANISFMLPSFPGGGVERVIMNLAQPLTEKGHRVFLFVHNLYEEKLPEVELPITYIKLPYKIKKSGNYDTILEAIKEYDIKIFFAPIFCPGYLKKLRATGLCKIVYVLHGKPFYEKAQKLGKITQTREFSIGSWLNKILFTIPKYKLGFYDRQMLRNYKEVYNRTDAYCVLFDDYGREIAKALDIDYETSRLCTLQNPAPQINDNGEEPRREKRIVYVGRLAYWDKRLDRLLAVWKRIYPNYPDWKLTFVGEGEDEANLRKIVSDNNIQRVEFLGWQNDPTNFYRTSEIMCMTSMVEGCPMALLEAQQCGCATMAFDCSAGIREILSPNWESGVYVNNGDIEAYAEALSRLMSDDELRKKIQENGIESAKRFSIETSVEQYNALINRLIS